MSETHSQLLPPGQYDNCTLISGVFGMSGANPPKPQFVFSVDIGQGTQRLIFTSLSDDARERAKERLKAIGWNGDVDNPQFANTTGLSLYCKHKQKWNPQTGKEDGPWQETWDFSGGYKPAAAPGDVKQVISTWWRNENRAATAPTGRPSAPPPANRPAPGPAPASRPAPAPTQRPAAAPSPAADPIQVAKDKAWEALAAKGCSESVWWVIIERVEKDAARTHANFTVDDWKLVAETDPNVPF